MNRNATRLAALGCLFAAAAMAQTTTTEWVPLWVEPAAAGTSTKAACNDRLRAMAAPVSATCVERIKKTAAAPAPSPSPAPAPAPAPSPAPAGPVVYFSDCQAGAAPGCTPGSNTAAGTEAAPKRDLSTTNIGALAAGTRLLFKRGGSWLPTEVQVENLRASAAAPITFDAYGEGPEPLFTKNGGVLFRLGGGYGNTTDDGGYVFRNLRLQGNLQTGSHWAFWFVQNVRDVLIENVQIEGFAIALNSSNGEPHGVRNIAVRNSVISRNADMGWLGQVSGARFEGNLFEGNNRSGSMMNHAVYLGGGNDNVFRGNRFVRNSVASGQCRGGNFTAHGQIDGLLIEGNAIVQDSSASSCGGYNVTAGYSAVEAFRNVVIRGNTGENLSTCLVCINSAPGAVIEGNRMFNTTGNLVFTYDQNVDTPMTGAVVRNNTICGPGTVTNLQGATVDGNRTLPLTDPACAR